MKNCPSGDGALRVLTRLPWISGAFCREFAGSPVCPHTPPSPPSVFRVPRLGSMLYSWRGGFCVYFQVYGAGKRSLRRIPHSPKGGASMLDLLIIRGIFILVLTISAYALHPFHSSPWMAAAAGTIFGLCIIFFEMR